MRRFMAMSWLLLGLVLCGCRDAPVSAEDPGPNELASGTFALVDDVVWRLSLEEGEMREVIVVYHEELSLAQADTYLLYAPDTIGSVNLLHEIEANLSSKTSPDFTRLMERTRPDGESVVWCRLKNDEGLLTVVDCTLETDRDAATGFRRIGGRDTGALRELAHEASQFVQSNMRVAESQPWLECQGEGGTLRGVVGERFLFEGSVRTGLQATSKFEVVVPRTDGWAYVVEIVCGAGTAWESSDGEVRLVGAQDDLFDVLPLGERIEVTFKVVEGELWAETLRMIDE